MEQTSTIWTATLESYRNRVGGSDSSSTGVSVAVIAATLGASLLQMVLELMAKRKSFPGDRTQLASLRLAARESGERLAPFADADIAAYLAYMEARGSNLDDAKLKRCRQRTIEVPLEAARAALAVLDLCGQARKSVSGTIIADLSTAAILIEGAIRAIVRCAEENLRSAPDPGAESECRATKDRAVALLHSVLATGLDE